MTQSPQNNLNSGILFFMALLRVKQSPDFQEYKGEYSAQGVSEYLVNNV
jgi:hypothetical protein